MSNTDQQIRGHDRAGADTGTAGPGTGSYYPKRSSDLRFSRVTVFWLLYFAAFLIGCVALVSIARADDLVVGVGTSELRRPVIAGHWEQDPFIATGAIKTPRSEDDHDYSYRVGVRMGDFELIYNNLGTYRLNLGFVACEGDIAGCVGTDMSVFAKGECYQGSPCDAEVVGNHIIKAHTINLTWAPYYNVWGLQIGPRLGAAYFTQRWKADFSNGWKLDTTVHGFTQTLGAGVRFGHWSLTYDKYSTLETDKDVCCSPVQKGSQASLNYMVSF